MAHRITVQDTFVKNLPTVAFRYFICDDSGSMTSTDGSVILGKPDDLNKRYFGFEKILSYLFYSYVFTELLQVLVGLSW